MMNHNYEWRGTAQDGCFELYVNIMKNNDATNVIKVLDLIYKGDGWYNVVSPKFNTTFSIKERDDNLAKEGAVLMFGDSYLDGAFKLTEEIGVDFNKHNCGLTGHDYARIASTFLPDNIEWRYDEENNSYTFYHNNTPYMTMKCLFHSDNSYFIYDITFNNIRTPETYKGLSCAENPVQAMQETNMNYSKYMPFIVSNGGDNDA